MNNVARVQIPPFPPKNHDRFCYRGFLIERSGKVGFERGSVLRFAKRFAYKKVTTRDYYMSKLNSPVDCLLGWPRKEPNPAFSAKKCKACALLFLCPKAGFSPKNMQHIMQDNHPR